MSASTVSTWKEILLTAIITSSLTLGCSYFIMQSQLSEEQNYWAKRFKLEQAQKALDKKIELMESINKGILESEVYVKNIKLSFSAFHASLERCREKDDCTTDSEELKNIVFEYHKHLNIQSSKIQMLVLYFPENVTSLINQLDKALENNYQDNSKTLIEFSADKKKNYEEYFNRNVDTIKELQDIRLKILKAMIDHIKEYSLQIHA